jgi:hypothetical protein
MTAGKSKEKHFYIYLCNPFMINNNPGLLQSSAEALKLLIVILTVKTFNFFNSRYG